MILEDLPPEPSKVPLADSIPSEWQGATIIRSTQNKAVLFFKDFDNVTIHLRMSEIG